MTKDERGKALSKNLVEEKKRNKKNEPWKKRKSWKASGKWKKVTEEIGKRVNDEIDVTCIGLMKQK